METPSDEAVHICTEYFQGDPSTHYYLPFLKDVICFLVDDFDIQLDANTLPTAAAEETVLEERIRVQVVDRLIEEFSENFDNPFNELAAMEEQALEGYAYMKTVEAFYFCLNRRQRRPSNLNRDPSVKTAKKLRDEKWEADIEKRFRQAERTIQRGVFPAEKTYSSNGLRRDSPFEPRGSESDTDTSVVVEATPQTNSPPQQTERQETEMALERNAGELDSETGVLLPPPLDLTPVDRWQVLAYLLQKVEEFHSHRYGEVLGHHSTVAIGAKLENILTPGVRLVSDNGLFSLEGLRSIGGDTKTTAAGVYLHIIWPPDDPQRFWLYVGQAMNLKRRIADHNDKLYRRKHPSLHYHVWDSREDMCSQFVVLATFNYETEGQNLPRSHQCLLNLLEMWMACLFRTLTARDLDRYLPPSVGRSSAGRHLNVVPPIWQRFQDETVPDMREIFDRSSFRSLLQSNDAAVRSWAQKARDSYNDLRNSPDPQLRHYWFGNNNRQLGRAWESNEQTAIDNLKVYHLEGKERTVQCAPDRKRGYITCGKFVISIPQSLNISPGSKVIVQFHLYKTEVPHRYTRKAMPYDPSSRLAISIKGRDASGNKVDTWLQSSRGSKLPMRMNTLVDMLEGVPFNETCSLSRRWIVTRMGEGTLRQTEYTD
ncbi:hypothetical protein PENFLA_c038G10811 [Penicillium flavigenum]|uniref:GIY-YIG domain-containing protein n=1 Tax=Penicillium flavigenum TaxID=254877 RepID=A0A1V6SKB1_9EURO|nr:hypothetical protein PENFLA_c038G10811 [Penicillium flavigenum]